jgi:hypothetical protein
MKTSLTTIYHQAFQALKAQKKLLLPFVIFAVIEAAVLTLIYLAPRAPFNAVFGPPIKTFRGEMYLHYPVNFLLIPELASLSRSILTVLIGSLLAGAAALMIAQVYQKKAAAFSSAIAESAKKYFQLFIIILSTAVILHYAYKGIARVIASYFAAGHKQLLGYPYSVWRGPITIIISIFILLIVQACIVYAVPFLMIGKQKLFKSIWRSVLVFGKNIWQTLLIVTLPFLFFIPVIILQYKTAYLIDNVFPEFVLIVAYLSILLSSLVIDLFVTMGATLYYLNIRKTDE